MDFSNILLNMSSTAATNGATAAQGNGSMTIMIIVFIAFMVVYMFMVSRKEKKQQQSEKDMRESIKVGDEILTIGGVLGKVVTVKEDSVVIETGADRTKIRFTKQAIGKNVTAEARAAEVKNAKVAAAQKAHEDKKAKKNEKKDK